MGTYAGRGRSLSSSSASRWIQFTLLGAVLSVLIQGVSCDVEPTESQCRSHIEKALKEQHHEIVEETLSERLIREQEENPPTDEGTDSTEGSIPNDDVQTEDERDDDDDDHDEEGEVKKENDDDDDGDDNVEDQGEDDDDKTDQQDDEEEREKDENEVEAEEKEGDGDNDDDDDDAKDDKDVQEESEKDGGEGETEEKEDGKEDEEDEKTQDETEDEEIVKRSVDDDDDDNDDDAVLERPIEIEVHEIEIDDQDDDKEDDQDEDQEVDKDDEKEDEKDEERDEEKEDDKDDKEDDKEGTDDETEGTEDDKKSVEVDDEDDKKDDVDEEQEQDDEKETKEEDDEKETKEEDDEKEIKEEDDEKETKEEDDEKETKEEDDDDKDESKAADEQELEEKLEKEEEAKESESEGATETEEAEGSKEDTADQDSAPEEEELIKEVVIPDNLRPRDHINKILKLDEDSGVETILEKAIDTTLKSLKGLYDNAIKPLEMLYKYRDLSNRHFGDPEIFSKPLILFMGPWSGGKSSTINYLLDHEFSHISLRTGAEPSPAYFNILMYGEEEEILDGTQLAADWTFSGLQKFGQSLLDRLKGIKLPNKLLEKVNIVEIPGILEIRKQVQRLFPFNDACQWFIDRADIIFLVYDPSKLDVGPETEAILDQLKGREYQTRIILNKADQVKPEELMRVQGTLIWNISPLMSSSEPPIMYSTSLWSMPYESGAPTRLLQAQERAFLRDLREAIDKRVENKIASARRFAVRVRNHAKMVDCYLTTYYNHKSIFGNRKKISDDIIEYPQKYHIYEGLSTLTNISRYDLPDPDVYRDFFKINPLYEFKKLSETCTYFRGCPINKLDVAIAYDLPEMVGRYKKATEAAAREQTQKDQKDQKENS